MLSCAVDVRVLDAADPEQRGEWLAAWTEWPAREVFAHPGYVSLYAAPGDRAMCAVLRVPGGGIVHPFIARDVSAMPGAQGAACDLVSPYGYGGPHAWGTGAEAAADFWRGLDEWAAGEGAVSEFIRFPLAHGDALDLPYPGDREQKQLNVARSLDMEMDELWMDFEHKVRKNVNKARRSGVTVVVDPAGERLDDFLRIYNETMDRREAGGGYYFGRGFFERIGADLPGQHCYLHALHEGEVISTELVLVSEENVYSFLGGTDSRFFALRPNDLLKHEIIAWAKAQRKRRFVLGGGYEPDDGIYRYKLAFAPHGAVPFFAGTRVLRPDAYEALVRARAAAEPGWQPRPGFFPAYRA